MATLVAVGPVELQNESIGKTIEAPLVSYSKGQLLTVTINGNNVAMNWDNNRRLFLATVNGHKYTCEGPRLQAQA